MLLSGGDDQILVGNFMGDFVKGPLGDRFPERIRQGVTLHRRIDSFASRDELFQCSRRRLDQHYGLYRGVLVDLFYDHFLVMEWSNWSGEPFDRYLARTRSIIEQYRTELPERMQQLVPVIFASIHWRVVRRSSCGIIMACGLISSDSCRWCAALQRILLLNRQF